MEKASLYPKATTSTFRTIYAFCFFPVNKWLSILIVLILSVDLNATLIQDIYREYFCEDTKDYLVMAGKKITTCGKVCKLVDVSSPSEEKAPANPPVKFQIALYCIESEQTPTIQIELTLTDAATQYANFYKFDFVNSLIKPPGIV